MPRLRFQRASPAKREALLDAATYEFGSHGYEDASMNRILLAAGFSKGSFYYYFDDKADLAIAVLERWAERYATLWDDLQLPSAAEDFWPVVRGILSRGTAQLREEPRMTTDAVMRLGTALAYRTDVRERLSTAGVTRVMTKVAAFWRHGQEVGAVREDLSVEQLLALIQDMKIALMRLLLPNDRAATIEEIEAFSLLHLDLVRRVAEKRTGPTNP